MPNTTKRTKKPAKPMPLVEEPVQVEEVVQENSVKSIFLSKTIWLNILAIVALILQKKFGFVLDESIQIEILGFINIALRMITKEAVTWGK
jgi:hypothetical protein